jgi:ATPase subunit of ABC transporter with duplicated ATPase domains
MLLQAFSLHFTLADRALLSGLNLTLSPGAKVALTGPNGSGKSTLLRILDGALQPDSGRVAKLGNTVLIGQHAPKEGLSGGEARMSVLREAFAANGGVLLLDEPTNDLDEDARAWLAGEIVRSEASLLIVSHDPLILDLVEEIWELKNGKLEKHPPGYLAYVQRLDEEEARLKEKIDSLKAQAKKAGQQARRVQEAQEKRMRHGEKAGVKSNLPKIIRGARKRQAQNTLAKRKGEQGERQEGLREKLSQMETRLRSLSSFEWDSSTSRPPEGKRLLEVRGAKLLGAKTEVSFALVGSRRIHLKGKNGSGKSTLLHALAGEAEARSRMEGNFYLTQPFHLFDQGLAQFGSDDPLWQWFHRKSSFEIPIARALLGRLGFEQEEQERPVNGLSGGERVRIELALALHAHGAEPPQLLLLDEPTNHLDLESRRILQRFVEEFGGGILLVSHDAAFVESLRIDEVVEIGG